MNKIDAIFPISDENIKQLENDLLSEFYTEKLGVLSNIYGYRDSLSRPLFVFVQCSKSSAYFYFSSEGWKMGLPNNIDKFPLFNLYTQKETKENFFIVDSEIKAITEIKDWQGLSYVGFDNKKLTSSNWLPLINVHNVIIWTDIKTARKIRKIIPHAKIIDDIDFNNCVNKKEILDSYLSDDDDSFPAIDPYEFYIYFIHDYYGHENLEQRNGSFWKYSKEKHYWEQEDLKNIKANFQTWMSEKKDGAGITTIDFLRSEGENVNGFMNKCIEFINRHAAGYIENNPFKDSAISPYIHTENGMIHLTKKNKYSEFVKRTDKNEDLFKKKFPVHCCNFDFSTKKEITINDVPVFKHIINSIIPKDIELSESEIKKTYIFFLQIIIYSLSPIKQTEYFFGFYGSEGTGKSFFVDILKDLIGNDFFVERPIDEMTGNNRFASSAFWGSKVYVEPDMKTDSTIPDQFIKSFAGQKNITVERKNKDEEKGVSISIAMFFISNFDFVTKGMEGIARRIIYVPFKNKIPNPDRNLRDKLRGEMKKGIESGVFENKTFDERPLILSLVIQEWKSFCKNNANFSLPSWVNSEKEDWKNKSDTIRGFLKEHYFDAEEYKRVESKELYREYKEWCTDELEKKPYGKIRFLNEIKRTDKIIKLKSGGSNYFEFNFPKTNDDGNPF